MPQSCLLLRSYRLEGAFLPKCVRAIERRCRLGLRMRFPLLLAAAVRERGAPWKRCAFCGGRLGLISHRKGGLRFCKQAHKSAYLQRQREQQEAEGRRRMWFDFLNAAPERAK